MNKKPKTTAKATAKKPAHKLKRAASSPVAIRHGTRAAAPALSPETEAQLAALAPAPVTGKIKLETSSMTHSQINAQLQNCATGMPGVPAYSTLPVMADITAAANAMKQQLTQLANMERDIKETRLSLDQWAITYGAVLNRAAAACEAADSTPATLVNGGWQLRRPSGPPQDMPAPYGLGLVQGNIAGDGTGKWRAVPNARYYEFRIDPVPGAPLTIAEPVTLTSTRTRIALPHVPPGSLLTICVRAVGAKGTGPFCDPLTVRVN